MSKPDYIPHDVWDAARKCGETVCRNLDYADVTIEVEAIANAIFAERNRCSLIIDAEIEMGGDDREAQRKIDFGEDPRYIPGWSAYDASKETDD